MKQNILLVLLVLFFSAAGQQVLRQTSDTLSLSECIHLALKNNLQIKMSGEFLYNAQASVQNSRASLLPQISGSVQALKNNASLSNQQYSAGISGQQLLFDFGKNCAKIQASQSNYHAVTYDSSVTTQSIVLSTITAYYSLLQAIELAKVSQTAFLQADAHLHLAKTQLLVGRGIKYNVVKAEVDKANTQLTLIKNRNSVKAKRLELSILLGMNIDSITVLTDSLKVVVSQIISSDSALQIALTNRPELKASALRLSAARSSLHAAKRSFLPQLTAGGSFGYKASTLSSSWTSNWNLNASLSVPLFQGGQIRSAVMQNEANLRIATLQDTMLVRSVLLEVELQQSACEEAASRLAIASIAIEQAAIALSLAKDRFSAGNGSALEMTDAELTFANSEIGHIQASFDYLIAHAKLKKAMGVLLP